MQAKRRGEAPWPTLQLLTADDLAVARHERSGLRLLLRNKVRLRELGRDELERRMRLYRKWREG